MRKIPKVLLMVESSRESGRALLRGIANYSHHHGPWSFRWETGGLEKAWPAMKSLDVDGIILRDLDNIQAVLAHGLPTVVIGHHQTEITGCVNVVTDSAAIGRIGAEHLIGCGFKHFAYCGYAKTAFENTPWSELRRKSFRAHLTQARFAPPLSYDVIPHEWSTHVQSMANWLKSLPKPIGLMACNDDCGQRVMEACKVADVAVPDAVGVVGVDNDEVVCGLTDPPMSSIAINFERAGYEAAHALHEWMRRGQCPSRRVVAVASTVIARRSTDFVATEQPNLRKALQYIRDHARGGLSVDEVATAAGISRRSLEKWFRKFIGRSVLQEVRRVRTDQIAKLLVETDLPVVQIADMLGFADTQHIARYFRSEKHSSPLNYRRIYGHRGIAQSGDSFPRSGVVAMARAEVISSSIREYEKT